MRTQIYQKLALGILLCTVPLGMQAQDIYMPVSSNSSIYACSNNFYDEGGTAGNYTYNDTIQTRVLTIYPAIAGNVVQLVFSSFDVGTNFFEVHDGISSTTTMLYNSNGAAAAPDTVTATNVDGALTIVFRVYYSSVTAGWTAAISCIGPKPCPYNVWPSDGQTGLDTSSFTITWASDVSPYMYNIYLGTTSEPAYYSNTSNNYFYTGPLMPGTTYYWKAVPVDTSYMEMTNCEVHSFTTVTAPIIPDTFKMPYSGTSPAIDGQTEGVWDTIAWTPIAKVYSTTSAVDLAANYKAFYSDNYLYFLVDVQDSILHYDTALNSWEDDYVEIYLDLNNDKSATYSSNDFQLRFRYGNNALDGTNAYLTSGIISSYSERTNGYTFEIQIPYSGLGMSTPDNDQIIGFDVSVGDNDDVINYSGAGWFSVDSTRWKNTSTWGVAKFLPKYIPPTLSFYSTYGGGLYSNKNFPVYIYSFNVNSLIVKYRSSDTSAWQTISDTVYLTDGYLSPSYNISTSGINLNASIMLEATDGSGVYTISDYVGVIAQPLLNILSPTSSSSFTGGDSIEVVYDYYLNSSACYANLYLVDSTGNQSYLASDYPTNAGTRYVRAKISGQADAGKYRVICSYILNNGTFADTSDYFTVTAAPPSIVVTSPTEGNVMFSGDNFTIIFDVASVDTASIVYSTDSMTTWNTVVSQVNTSYGNNYTWTVPVVSGKKSNCYIRMSNLAGTVYSTSGRFTISNEPEAVSIVSPSAGEIYNSDNSINVIYNSTYRGYHSFDVYISLDAGAKYIYSTSCGGGYGYSGTSVYVYSSWGSSNTCLIKFVEPGYPDSVLAVSNLFRIQGPALNISFYSPSWDSYWVVGDTSNLIQFWANTSSKVKISLSSDGGANWRTLVNNYSCINGENNYYIPGASLSIGDAGKNAVVMIEDTSGLAVKSYFFNISSVIPSYSVLQPSNGAEFTAGQNIKLIIANNGPYGAANIYLYSDSGYNQYLSNVYLNEGSNSVSINLPSALLTDSFRFQVINSGGYSRSTYSGKFKVVALPPSLTFVKPDMAYIYFSNTPPTLEWTSNHLDSVRFEYSSDNKATWTPIPGKYASYDGVINNAYPAFPLPDVYSETSYIKAISDAPAVEQISKVFITSNKADTFMFYEPLSGAEYFAGNTVSLSFEYRGRWRNSVSIYFKPSPTADTSLLVTTLDPNYNLWGVRNIYWNIPPYLASTDSGVFYAELTGLGNYYSPLVKIHELSPSLNLGRPYADQYWQSGKKYPIQWYPVKVDMIKMELSTDGGSSWTLLKDSVSSISYTTNYDSIIAPAFTGLTTTAKFKITSLANSSIYYASNNFMLSNLPEAIRIIKPDSNAIIKAGTNFTCEYNYRGDRNTGLQFFIKKYNEEKEFYLDNEIYNPAIGLNTSNIRIPEYFPATDSAIFIIADKNHPNNNLSQSFLLSDTSDFFTVLAADPYININSPNISSYVLGGSTTSISFYALTTPKVQILYSTDAGLTWTSIVDTIECINGTNSYTWTVPLFVDEMPNCRVKIVSLSDNSVYALSQVFQITNIPAGVTIISPNGGEQYKAGNSYYIEYKYIGEDAYWGMVDISSNNGASWNTLTELYNEIKPGKNYFLLNIPAYLDSGNLYKIRLTINDKYSDVSDGVFSVLAGESQIKINYPTVSTGYLKSDNFYSISWNSALIDAVDIAYSIDGGSSWNDVITNLANYNGYNYYYWKIPQLDSIYENSVLRIMSTKDSGIVSYSNIMLSNVDGTINILQPDSSTVWEAGEYVWVNFEAKGLAGDMGGGFYLRYNQTDVYIGYIGKIVSGYNSVGFMLPYTLDSGLVRPVIRFYGNTANGKDSEQAYVGQQFFIKSAGPFIKVFSPTASNYFVKNESGMIRWNSFKVKSVNIDLTLDGGLTWKRVASDVISTYQENMHEFVAPDTSTNYARFRITPVDTTIGIVAESETFTIFNGQVTLTLSAPNGNQLIIGQNFNVEFNYTGGYKAAYISVSNDSMKTWNNIQTVTTQPGNNIMQVFIPYDAVPGSYWLRVIDQNNVGDTSLTFSNVIAPLPFINVTHPAYGNLLTSGTINKISWNSFNADTMDIYYSLDSGITYNHIISDFVSGGSTGYYNWTLPVVSGNKNAFVKLISASGTVGISNWFIISDKGAYLALNSPNGGETYTAESSIELSYNYFGSNNIYVSVFVSADSGITWNQINGSFYTTPGLNKIPLYLSANYASNKAFIRIQKSDNPGMYDISNATFTISSASANIAVKQPSQGVYWVSGSVKTIQWNSFDVPAVKLEYSIDSAASWNTIISNVMSLNGLNSYNWAIPSITGTFKNCQVRISGGIIADTSYLFTLSDRYPSTDARLTTLLVDSTAISGFNDTVYSYTYTVPYSTTVPPVIDGITFDTLARKVVVDASAIPGDAYVDVTAEDGTTTKRYTVSFVKGSPSEEALLKEIDLDGVKMKGFVSGIFNYNSTVAAYAYSAPVVSAVATTTNAIINIVQASTVNGTARVTVTSESGGTTNTYFVKFNQAAFDIIDNETFNTAENRNVGAVIGIFATKNWNSRALNYVISEGNDDGIFDINANGELLLVDSAQLDYENASLSNPYFLMVAVQPADDPTRTDFAAVTINISDANDVPRIVHGQILSVAENSTSGTFVNNVLINHQDVGQYVTYSILSGNTNDAFAIETVNDGGRLTVNNAAMLNYEETQQFALIIQASDNGSPIMSSTDTVRVTVTNVNESPVIADAVMYVKEYSANGTIIDTARASDVDLTDHITYSIQYQPITGVFTIDATSGAIKLLDSSKIDYATKSQYLLRIRATDLSGAFKEAKVTIFVIDVPYKTVYADFEYTVDNVNPLLLSFNSTSTGNPTAYFWTFGDGQSFVGSSTDHSYNSAGLYNVCLTVVDDKEGYTDKKCYNVQVGQPTCVIAADFGYGVNGDTIFITNASNGNIASYYWTFGDGTTSFDKDPVHIYNTEGYYLVTLAVSDTAKKCTDFNSQFVKIGAVSCLADFTYISNEKNVTFTNNSEGTISYYFWDFGDGTFDTGTSPEHVYRKNGKYMVSLTVANSDASCMDNLMMPVQVGSFSCNAAFTYILEQGTYSVLFTEDDLPESANVLWSFGDGHASADHNPTYKYKYPGYYTVSLNTFNAASNCMDFYQEVILVGEEGDDCEADFIYQISSTNPNNVKFIDKSKGAIEYYIWDYNDDYIEIANNPDHTFQKTGYFNVCLTVITPKDISNTTCKKVGVGVTENANIIANFTYVVKGDSVYFADISKGRVNKWEWNFGGGLSNGTDSVEKVKYSASGYYVVSMKASNTASGATDKIYKVVNIGKADTMLARFGFDAQNYNAKAGGYPVDFIGAGLGDQTKLKWDFGDTADYKDNIDTTNTNPTHNYPEGGQQYYVCYTIKDPITEDSSKYCEYITTKEQVNIKQTNNLTVSLSAYPNPFTTSAFITYQLKSKSKVQLSIYDINGRLINNIISATQEAGPYMLKLDGSVLEEGVYVIKLKTNNGTVEQMLMKQ